MKTSVATCVLSLLAVTSCGPAPTGALCEPGWAAADNADVCCPETDPYAADDGFCYPSLAIYSLSLTCEFYDVDGVGALVGIVETAQEDGLTRAEILEQAVLGCQGACDPIYPSCPSSCVVCMSAVVDAVY